MSDEIDARKERIWQNQMLDALSQLLRKHRVKRILDLGLGGFELVRKLPDANRYVYLGIGFSDQVVERIRRKDSHLQVIRGETNSLANLDSESPDLILCLDVLPKLKNGQADNLCRYMFNCGARAILLNTFGKPSLDGLDRGKEFQSTFEGLGFVSSLEQPFRKSGEMLVSINLCEPWTDRPPTDVVYVCTPERSNQLFVSMRSLFESGTSFDRVVVFCVGRRPSGWTFSDSRIIVREVEPVISDFFFANKIHLCDRAAPRVVYLDADTLILRPLENIWDGKQADILARQASAYLGSGWDDRVWQETLRKLGGTETPLFNAGFVIFQNGCHQRIRDLWLPFIRDYLSGNLTIPGDFPKFYEQLGLALAIAVVGLDYSLLTQSQHSYGWQNEPYSESVVYHTSGWFFDKFVQTIRSDEALQKTLEPMLHTDRKLIEKLRGAFEKFFRRH